MHVLSPQVDGVRSELPMQVLNGLQMTQRESSLCVVTGGGYLSSLKT